MPSAGRLSYSRLIDTLCSSVRFSQQLRRVLVCTFGELPGCNFSETSPGYVNLGISAISVMCLRTSAIWVSVVVQVSSAIRVLPRWSDFYCSVIRSLDCGEPFSLPRRAVFLNGFYLRSRSVPSLIFCFVNLPCSRLR